VLLAHYYYLVTNFALSSPALPFVVNQFHKDGAPWSTAAAAPDTEPPATATLGAIGRAAARPSRAATGTTRHLRLLLVAV